MTDYSAVRRRTGFFCFSWMLAASLLLGGCSGPGDDTAEETADRQTQGLQPDAGAIAANNRGVGLMGQFRYAQAEQVFADLVGRYPDWLDARVNLAIATLNRQQEGDEQAALAMVQQVLQQDPENLRAQYVAGLLQLYLSSPQQALPHFQRVVDGDPKDANAAYYLAQCLAQQSDYQQALDWYRRAIAMDPYLRSAYYGAFQTLQRLKRRQEARALIGDYQRLANNPRAHLAEFKYTRMGPKAEALAVGVAAASSSPVPTGPVFLPRKPLAPTFPVEMAAGSGPVSITVADIQGDDRPDLFLAGVSDRADRPNLLLLRRPDGGFAAQPDHPLARVGGVNAALWGDYDNDGLTDVYLCRKGANQLWRQSPRGQWQDVTETTGTRGGEYDTLDGAFFDADHDGDLDLFLVNGNGPNELLSNNLDGSFRALATKQGIAGDGRASRRVIPVDIDQDRDVDILVLNAEPPHEVYLNDRLWAYHAATGLDEFKATPALAAVAGDLDADGSVEIFTLLPDGRVLRWQRDSSGQFKPETYAPATAAAGPWAGLALLDVNGDGELELLRAGPEGWSILGGRSGFQFRVEPDQPLLGLTPVLLDAARGPALIGLQRTTGIAIWAPGPGRHDYLAVTLSGREEKAQSMRSNASGIGARLALRVGSNWTLRDSFFRGPGPGQSLQPIALGLGGARQADFLAIDWSDGVYQTELDLPAGKLSRIEETQRQLSSCPVLFVWDGQRYRFVTDLLGVGGLGYAVAPGIYATPRPWENLLLPKGLPIAKQGRFRLKFTEPMEEALYLDDARLVAYDLPPGWQMVLDERMGIEPPEPSGEPRFFRREMVPVRAENERGEEVTDTIAEVDGHAAPPGPLDRRFIGRLAGEHILDLRFPEPVDAGPGQPLLMIDGWVEYPYSQTSFAAWQAGARFDAPTLEARGADGRWRPVLKQFGYPAGMPRRMSLPLPALPAGTAELRLRTNQQIYWDRVALVYAEDPPHVRRHRFPLVQARVAKTGFPQRITHPQQRPDYDYSARQPFWDTRYMAGLYTRLGVDIRELLADTDDAVAIIGAGEEIHLEFDDDDAALADGWSRRYVLESNGWAKDMDLFTRAGETLAPLPSSGRPSALAERLHARYNLRYQAGP